MKEIAYLLHRFPRITDTFIMREIRALHKMGTDIEIISVWRPNERETNSEVINEWFHQTRFLLPGPILSTAWVLCKTIICSPITFFSTARLAYATSRPGLRGFVYQNFYLAEAMLAAEVLKKNEIVHVHNHFGDHTGIITMLAAKLADITYSISFHGPHVFFDGQSERIKEKVSHARFTRCISYFCRSQVILFSNISDFSSLKVVHCGLELSRYRFRLPRKEVKTIFCASRLAPEKGFEFLVEAIRILKDKNYDLEIRLVGDGPSREGLERIARDLGISDRVHFLGHLDEAEKMHELQSSDLCVLPSLAEGLPSSATEAMAVGVPVIATNIAAISELIEHGKTGLLVRPSDPGALADAVIKMVDDYEFRRRAAQLGRTKVIEEFDVDKETARLKSYLFGE